MTSREPGIGTNGVAQVDTRGVIAAGFDHWDSRSNDPNLHTHVVIANRVQGPDGRWRTLDSRGLHHAAVAMSELYDGLLADRLTARLGLGWEYRERGPRRNPSYELAVVPPELVAEFSRRSRDIDVETDRLIAAYVAGHGRHPDPATVLRLRQQATLATRETKIVHSLHDLTGDWRARAQGLLGNPDDWVREALSASRAGQPAELCGPREPRSSGVSQGQPDPHLATGVDDVVADAATAALATLSRKRPTWTTWNAHAEASRALRAHRFATPAAREQATERVVAEIAARAVRITPDDLAATPDSLRRSDGSSAFRPTNAERYTSHELLDAEGRLLRAGRERTAPTAVPQPSLATDAQLFADQADAVGSIAQSRRLVDVLVGPAGSGKTRTLAALRLVWEAEHGPSSVVGLAPSASAADVLAASLGIPTENTAKWLVEHDSEPARIRRAAQLRAAIAASPDPATTHRLAHALRQTTAEIERWRFRPGQLVIIDEASLAGTLDLDRIAACTAEACAKLLLVGDWAQLSSVDAGGAFGLLVRDRGTGAPELGAARRFTHPWERDASTQLRVGDPASLDAYVTHDRIRGGDQTAMVDAAWQGWAADEQAGRRSLMIAADRDTVRALNERARAERVTARHVHPAGALLHDGLIAGVGDRVVTRRNDRRLTVGRGWVKNGDTWTVTAYSPDGALTVQRPGGGPAVRLPADYVAAHVELGYATTAHRAQGATVDTAHAVLGAAVSREVLYVMLTRARNANHVYVATDRDAEPLTGFTDEHPTAQGVLRAALANPGRAISAHEIADGERENAHRIATLAAEYETLASIAQAPRWDAELSAAGLPPEQRTAIAESPARGALHTALRRAEAHHLPLQTALPRLVTGISADARDPAAVLHARIERWTASVHAGQTADPEFVAWLIPAPRGELAPDVAQALTERAILMNQRVDELLARAERADAAWLAALGPRPQHAEAALPWDAARRAVAAYRDSYHVTSGMPLGPETADLQQAAARTRCVQLITSATGSGPSPEDAVPPRASTSVTRPWMSDPRRSLTP